MSKQTAREITSLNGVWDSIRASTRSNAEQEPMLASFLHATILNHRRFEDAVSYQLASGLDFGSLRGMQVRDIIDAAFEAKPEIADCIKADIVAVVQVTGMLEAVVLMTTIVPQTMRTIGDTARYSISM